MGLNFYRYPVHYTMMKGLYDRSFLEARPERSKEFAVI